jgi:hypothetical protein
VHVAIKALWGLQRHHPHRVRPNPSWKLALTLHFDHPEWGCYHCILGVVFCLAQLLSYVVSPPFINYIYIYVCVFVCVFTTHNNTLWCVLEAIPHTVLLVTPYAPHNHRNSSCNIRGFISAYIKKIHYTHY